jgi:hypothetical protein
MHSQQASDPQHFELAPEIMKTSRSLAQDSPRAKADAPCGSPKWRPQVNDARYHDTLRLGTRVLVPHSLFGTPSNRNVSLREPRRVAQTTNWVS